MTRVILQVPMPVALKQQAEAVASDYGFSSLQEIIRVVLRKLAKRELTISIQEAEEITYLTPSAEKRYQKAIEDIKKDRNLYKPKNAKKFLEMLHS